MTFASLFCGRRRTLETRSLRDAPFTRQPQSILSKLPAELRISIYEFVFSSLRTTTYQLPEQLAVHGSPRYRRIPPILLVCSEVYAEARSALFSVGPPVLEITGYGFIGPHPIIKRPIDSVLRGFKDMIANASSLKILVITDCKGYDFMEICSLLEWIKILVNQREETLPNLEVNIAAVEERCGCNVLTFIDTTGKHKPPKGLVEDVIYAARGFRCQNLNLLLLPRDWLKKKSNECWELGSSFKHAGDHRETQPQMAMLEKKAFKRVLHECWGYTGAVRPWTRMTPETENRSRERRTCYQRQMEIRFTNNAMCK